MRKLRGFLSLNLMIIAFAGISIAQGEMPPAPAAPKSINIPAVKETKLTNGIKVVVIEKRNLPLVSVQFQADAGATDELASEAGLASLTAGLLTKGTKTRTATQIAEQMEFLGGSINSGAGWNAASVSIGVTSDKLDQAMAIMSDVVLNPKFDQKEIDSLKDQTIDGLNFSLTQPGSLASAVASRYSFGEHPPNGTPDSVKAITRQRIVDFYGINYFSSNPTLIFTGDITLAQANILAKKYFGKWRSKDVVEKFGGSVSPKGPSAEIATRMLVIDLPESGQAAVSYAKMVMKAGRGDAASYYPASVLNSLLGGGYSSRLNQEIRIKRGLSYGAGSSFGWRSLTANFSARTQTKNESAAEVAELVIAEIKRLANETASTAELDPRKAVLTGDFGRDLATVGGLTGALSDLYLFRIPPKELNNYMSSVRAVSPAQIRDFAKANLMGGDVIIVGDYAKFKDDLAKRFPSMKIEVIKSSELDLNSDSLKKK